jgi:hypothetical protein
MAENTNVEDWIWVERVLSRFPINYFVLSYFLFLILFSLFLFFGANSGAWLDLSNPGVLLVVLVSSFIIPFELAGIKLQMDGSKDLFLYLDTLFGNSKSRFYESLRKGMLESGRNYMLLMLSVGLPLVALSWHGLNFYMKQRGNPFNLGLDIYYNFVLLLTIYLLCIILWIKINTYWAFHNSSKELEGHLLDYNVFILRKKLISVRSYFLIALIFYILCISLINISLFGFGHEITFNAVFLIMLFLFGAALTLGNLNDTQRIIAAVIEQQLDSINVSLEDNSTKMRSILAEGSENYKDEIDRLQKIIDLQRMEWDRISQEKAGLNTLEALKEAGAFIITIIIPIISFIISFKHQMT